MPEVEDFVWRSYLLLFRVSIFQNNDFFIFLEFKSYLAPLDNCHKLSVNKAKHGFEQSA